MKKYLILIAGGILFSASIVSPALAHVLQSDGNIGAVLHIDPADDPIAGEPATFYFETKDKENKFETGKCKCTVNIIKAGNVIYTQQLNNSTSDITNPQFSFTFPERGIYTVELAGEPTAKDAFQSFKLSYDVRADRVSTPTSDSKKDTSCSSHLVLYIILAAAFLVVFFSFANRRKKGNPENIT